MLAWNDKDFVGIACTYRAAVVGGGAELDRDSRGIGSFDSNMEIELVVRVQVDSSALGGIVDVDVAVDVGVEIVIGNIVDIAMYYDYDTDYYDCH